MTTADERRKKTVLDWIVPALLGLISLLVGLGGANVAAALRDNAAQTFGLREDVHAWQLRTEIRLTRMEDAMSLNGQKEARK